MPKLSSKLMVVAMLLTPLPAFAQGGGGRAAAPEADRPAVLQRAVRPADPQPVAAALLVRPMPARLAPEQPVSVACPPVQRMLAG